MSHANHSEIYAIRDAPLAATGRYPRPALELFASVTGEWGSICERRLWRALDWLVSLGKVRRVGDRYHSQGYVRVPDAQPTQDELAARRLLELAEDRKCLDCEGPKRSRKDPPWFKRFCSRYCYRCYRVRNMARRAA